MNIKWALTLLLLPSLSRRINIIHHPHYEEISEDAGKKAAIHNRPAKLITQAM